MSPPPSKAPWRFGAVGPRTAASISGTRGNAALGPAPVIVHVGEPAEVARFADEVRSALAREVEFDQYTGPVDPDYLLALREGGVPHAVFLHDFTPLCPTRHLWRRVGERCSGPGRTGWKCAWCVSGDPRRWAQLPWRFFEFRHRPQQWHTALLRADLLLAPSRFARDRWIEHNLPPDRITVVEPRLVPAAVPPGPAAGNNPDASAAALELLPAAARARAARDLVLVAPDAEPAYSRLAAEAQALGRPVVAAALGGLPEQVIHGVNGYLAAPGDFGALAEAMAEALGSAAAPAWGGALLPRRAAAQCEESRARLLAVLRMLVGAGPLPPEISFRRQLALNHAVAFFRACGCRRIAALPENEHLDRAAAAWFAAWGLEVVAAEALPDGLWFEAPGGDLASPALLRRRFPQAKALVEVLADGIETTDWLSD